MRMEQDVLDPVAVERAEKSIDELMNSRSKAKDKANAEADLWRISERRQLEKRRETNREAWRAYHLRQAERLEATAAELARDHRARAEALLSDRGGEGAAVP
jgi:hypothetical protein